MIIKILDLNLWGYNDFNERKKLIVDFVKKHDPDVIAFQEVRDDSRQNKIGYNQLKQLNQSLKYKYSIFFETTDVNHVNKITNDPKYDPTNPRVKEGLGILSKLKIVESKGFMLNQHTKDGYPRGILWARLENNIDVINVHYSFNDLFSKLHLEETLKIIKENRLHAIITGDLNILNQKIIDDLASKDYKISSNEFNYISYPSKNQNLDHILIPKQFEFKSFKCIGPSISDHKALLAEIQI
jgi:endonuclease/exonuclease/phosphatase family metal-dependent hydrolase